MIGKWLSRSVIVGGILAMAMSAPMASACSINTPIKYRPAQNYDIRDECRDVLRDFDQILMDLRQGKREYLSYAAVASAFAEGLGKCKKRPDLALALMDAAIGSPVRLGSPTYQFLELVPDDYSEDRRQEVIIGQWLLGETLPAGGYCSSVYYQDSFPAQLSAKDVLPTLVTEHFWRPAIANFGNNPARDRLVLQRLIDPSGPKFDLALAKELAPKFGRGAAPSLDRMVFAEVSEAITDPNLGAPNYEAAAELLDWYSPYENFYLSEDETARIENLWTRINQTRLANSDPDVARTALLALQTGDPQAVPGQPFSEVIPEGAGIVVLDKWPDSLPAFRFVEWWVGRIAGNYPQRALRQYQTGRVDYGIIFNPDGSFHSLHVTKSAGETLDRAALQGARRYIRPRINQLSLTGYEGSYVYVPLPSNEYHYGYRKSDLPNTDPIGDYTIYITGFMQLQ